MIFLLRLWKKYADNIFYPMLNIPAKDFDKSNLNDIIRKMIDSFVQNHKLSKSAHEEINGYGSFR